MTAIGERESTWQLATPVAPKHRLCRTAGATISEFVLPPSFAVPTHEHVQPHICVILDGQISDVDRNTAAPLPAGSLRYSPGGDNHRIEVSPEGARCLVIEAPGFPELRLTHRVYIDTSNARPVVTELTRWLFEEQCASPARIEDAVLSLFCSVREASSTARITRPAWIDDVRRLLDNDTALRRPLADAARLVDRSPNLVARAFRAVHAVSIHRYYRRRQIDHAWRMLSDSTDSLANIAYKSGFADQSHMNRIFVRETGLPPAQLRAQLSTSVGQNWFQAAHLRVITS